MPGQNVPSGQSAQAFVFEKFGTLNTKANRTAIKDEEFAGNENWMPIGDGNLRTMWDVGTTLYTASNPRTIHYAYFYNLGSTTYAAVFLDDGTAYQINVATSASVTISSTASTFLTGDIVPTCAQWESKYLLIGSTQSVNGYWVWDGTSLFTAGTIAPQITVTNGGKNYTSQPVWSVIGAVAGSGATFTSTIDNKAISEVTVLTPGSGFLINDYPALAVGGGGSDTTATATATVDNTTSGVGSVTVRTGGTGYTSSSVITFTGGGGAGAAAVISEAVNGVILGITVTNPGTSYTSAPTIAVSVGSGATFTVNMVAGQITAISLVNGGSGYVGAPDVLISGDGTGATATAQITTTSGGVASIQISDGGSGYSSAPAVTFSSGAAAATAYITGGVVTSVVVTAPGSGYGAAPTVIFTGAHTTPAVATATVFGNAISGITVTNPGTGYTKATVQLIGGNNAAAALVDLMPFGIEGSSLETYQGRVWLANGTKASFTGAESVSNFSSSFGGGSFPATDSFLRDSMIRFAQSNGFLYYFGDSSVNVISNVQTQGNPVVTTFNNSNVDPQVGTPWRDSVVAYGRALVFANTSGIYALYGGAAEKVSGPLDGVFENAYFDPDLGYVASVTVSAGGSGYSADAAVVFSGGGGTGVAATAVVVAGVITAVRMTSSGTGYTSAPTAVITASTGSGASLTPVRGVPKLPTSSVATTFGIRVYLFNFTGVSIRTGLASNMMACWDGQKWWVAIQSHSPDSVTFEEIDSELTAWGYNQSILFPMFQKPSNSIIKWFLTKLRGDPSYVFKKQANRFYLMASNNDPNVANVTCHIDRVLGTSLILSGEAEDHITTIPASSTSRIPGNGFILNGYTVADYGNLLGATVTSTAKDIVINSLTILYNTDYSPYA